MKGLIACRSWRIDDRGRLTSSFTDNLWASSEFQSDEKPDLVNDKGVHAYKLDNRERVSGRVGGIVELKGEILEHSDGVLRAEYCKILKLFINMSGQESGSWLYYSIANSLFSTSTPVHNVEPDDVLKTNYQIYGVPIVSTDNIKRSMDKWVKDNSWVWEHNKKTMDSVTQFLLQPEIEHERYEPTSHKIDTDVSEYWRSSITIPSLSQISKDAFISFNGG